MLCLNLRENNEGVGVVARVAMDGENGVDGGMAQWWDTRAITEDDGSMIEKEKTRWGRPCVHSRGVRKGRVVLSETTEPHRGPATPPLGQH